MWRISLRASTCVNKLALQRMDYMFLLDEQSRAPLLRNLMQNFGCTYICLWTPCFPPSRVPGLAFKNGNPYFELKDLDLLQHASIEMQSQFYQEARIKTAIFMGCKNGEIEIGMSNESQLNMEMEMRNWFPEDFSRPLELPFPTNQTRPSSSSSSLRSLSMESPESSPLLINLPNTAFMQEPFTRGATSTTATSEQALNPTSITSINLPFLEAMQAFQLLQNIPFATIQGTEAAMTRAILTVLSSPSISSSSTQPPQQELPPLTSEKASAFKSYQNNLPPTTSQIDVNVRRQYMLKRAMHYLRIMNLIRHRERMQASNIRPITTHLQHMISERKRREKLNESFQALRALLPPGTKKDKASVLESTRKYLTLLKEQVSDLSQKIKLLEAKRLLPKLEAGTGEEQGARTESTTERLNVSVIHHRMPEVSTQEDHRVVDLHVAVRGDCTMLNLVAEISRFLRQVNNIIVVSMEAETQMRDSSPINHVILRLRIEGDEWDESAFVEAVRRVVADLAQ
ncbi:Myc-type, basic helix-loop-helix (bHLH) domain [Dillenia turbinata]|uniref:Myc-type, basic helix-loop-helix (BHLH) domain n=1 Tax=Dillenia turbinata TaxID=194707 RepID=A0AAN8W8V5_9MAGN